MGTGTESKNAVRSMTAEPREQQAELSRVGSVPYLNARPLIYGLPHGGIRGLALEVPSRLARRLHNGELDLALVPSIEYFRSRGYYAIPGIGIVSHGPVWSVKLFSKKPLNQIQAVGIDVSSRASAALVRVILRKAYGLNPSFLDAEPTLDALNDKSLDALLLIGDPAMKAAETGLTTLDLGEAWKELTGLPFVYAFWVLRPTPRTNSLVEEVLAARDSGLRNLAAIAATESLGLGLSEKLCYEYLSSIISYKVGNEERAGLEEFQRLAAAEGLCDADICLKFWNC